MTFFVALIPNTSKKNVISCMILLWKNHPTRRNKLIKYHPALISRMVKIILFQNIQKQKNLLKELQWRNRVILAKHKIIGVSKEYINMEHWGKGILNILLNKSPVRLSVTIFKII